MRIKRKTKNILKIVICCVVLIGVVIGAVALISNLTGKDDPYERIKPKFKVGGLTSTGKYIETENSLYTEDPFYCEGLKITRDFESSLKYQVYYYDELDNFISRSELYSASAEMVIPEGAIFARLVLIPFTNSGDQSDKLNFFDAIKYPRELKIEVASEMYTLRGLLKIGVSGFDVVALKPEALVFTNGYTSSNGVITENLERAVTADYALKVSAGDSIIFNSKTINGRSIDFAYETFCSMGALVESVTSLSGSNSFTVGNGVSFVRIIVKNAPFTDAELALLPSCISLVKA